MIQILESNAEQLPYTFSEDFKSERVYLKTGDYTIKGYEDKFAIERKSLDDYTKTITKEWDRFSEELKRLQSYDCKFVIVEGNITQILSRPEPDRILALTYSIIYLYKIPVLFFETRQAALYFIEGLIKYYVEKNGKKKTKRTYSKRTSKEDIL